MARLRGEGSRVWCHRVTSQRVKTPPLCQGVCNTSEVDVNMNMKALGPQAGPHCARDCSVVTHTQEGLAEASRLVSSGTGTICPRRPTQAPGILPHLLPVGLLCSSSWWAQRKVSGKHAQG